MHMIPVNEIGHYFDELLVHQGREKLSVDICEVVWKEKYQQDYLIQLLRNVRWIHCLALSGGMVMHSRVSACVPKRCFLLSCWTLSTAQLSLEVTSSGTAALVSRNGNGPDRSALRLYGNAGVPCCEGPEDWCLLWVEIH